MAALSVLGIEPVKSPGFKDGENDIPLLEGAGLAVAIAYAVSLLKLAKKLSM